MGKIIMTSPLTGLKFEAAKEKDGSLSTENPITGTRLRIPFNEEYNAYMINPDALEHVETITQAQAAELVGVSKSRISALCQSGRIKSVSVGSSVFVNKQSAIEYRDSERKAGRKW